MADRAPGSPQPPDAPEGAPNSIQLINVLVVREGEMVSAKWGIHPQLKKELSQAEWEELSEHMNRVTSIVGAKFVEQLSKDEGNTSGRGTA
ncbi:MAG TPA: hypothetical protein VE201_00860 [Nitrospirales bacterium]|jgi:hypothetical protein|nr:hypothetical protein [Nitrospirales bacterium]